MSVLKYFKEIFLGEEEDLSEEEINKVEKFTFSTLLYAAIGVAAFMINTIGVILIFG